MKSLLLLLILLLSPRSQLKEEVLLRKKLPVLVRVNSVVAPDELQEHITTILSARNYKIHSEEDSQNSFKEWQMKIEREIQENGKKKGREYFLSGQFNKDMEAKLTNPDPFTQILTFNLAFEADTLTNKLICDTASVQWSPFPPQIKTRYPLFSLSKEIRDTAKPSQMIAMLLDSLMLPRKRTW